MRPISANQAYRPDLPAPTLASLSIRALLEHLSFSARVSGRRPIIFRAVSYGLSWLAAQANRSVLERGGRFLPSPHHGQIAVNPSHYKLHGCHDGHTPLFSKNPGNGFCSADEPEDTLGAAICWLETKSVAPKEGDLCCWCGTKIVIGFWWRRWDCTR